MKLNNIWYLIRQGLRNLWLNRLMSVASAGVLTVCFLLIGAASLFSYNMRAFAHGVEKQNELVVFVDDGMARSVAAKLKKIKNVASYEFVSKVSALEKQLKRLDNEGELFRELMQANPLPDSFKVSLHDVDIIEKTAKKITKINGVQKVKVPKEVAKVITTLKNTITYAGFIIVGILLVVSIFIIATTIKITIYERRREINIMKFVGASNSFIRFPFIIEGVIIGIVAALFSYGILYYGYLYMFDILENFKINVAPIIKENIAPFSELSSYLFGGFLGVGCLVGMFGSVFFVRKYLKV
ncbi:MAG: permease-like cell division protein FtsX [Oscillospiraceae bacterium]|nr:permease-like cell division protein FtsX [Oscillospiraceae bacterium]